jgi:hypothetical protein
MIVESIDVLEVPAGGVPIVGAVVRMDVGFACICKAFVHTILNGSDSADGSTGPFFHILIDDSDSSSVKGFSNHFVVDVFRRTLVSNLSQFFFLLVLLEV